MKSAVKIAITGPESCGKSTLAEKLAAHFNTKFVAEFARKFLEKNGNQYDYETILFLAKKQIEKENEAIKSTDKILFCDTDLINFKIWLEHENYKVPSWLLNEIKAKPYTFTLLLKPDIPWEKDTLRGFPHKRDYFFEWFKKELHFFEYDFKVIGGVGKERLIKSIDSIKSSIY